MHLLLMFGFVLAEQTITCFLCSFFIPGICSVEQHTGVRSAVFLGHEFASQHFSVDLRPDRGSMASSQAKLPAAGLAGGLGLGEAKII